MALDTVMLCYCEDIERHSNNKDRVYAGAPLRKAMGISGEVPTSPKKASSEETPKGNVVVPLGSQSAPTLTAAPTSVKPTVTADDDL